MRRRLPPPQQAFTLPELVLVLAIVGLLSLIAIRQLQLYLDRLATRAAVTQAALMLGRARDESVAQHTAITLRVDSIAGTLALSARGQPLASQTLGHDRGVVLSANRDSITFDARGLGYGAANMTLIVRRREAANTLVVSRLGRARY
jgi:prepilin-type N-terminal cleavage/methylation domain-containing protein